MAFIFTDIITYLKNNKSIVVATVDEHNAPDLRTIGGYNFDGITLYFATDKTSNKSAQIAKNDEVAVLVQHENQVLPDFVNLTLYGKARRLTGAEFTTAKNKLLERKPYAIYDENSKNIYQVIPQQIKILDLSKKQSEQVRIIKP
jgi:uncharacterized pyridoxamine 5'-phosphate oxidase family protein